VEGTCGKGSEGSQHKPYVAKKKSLSAGVGLSAPSAPVLNPIATPVVEVRVDRGADQAGKGCALAAPGVKPPGSVLEKSAPPVVEVLVDRGAGHPGKGSLPAEGVDLEIEEDGSSDVECSGQGQKGAGLPPAVTTMEAEPIASPLCPEEGLDAGDVGWTRVGKKGKNKKKAGQPGMAAVQQQSDGEDLQDVDPVPDRFLYPYIPRWKGKGKGRQSFGGRGYQM